MSVLIGGSGSTGSSLLRRTLNRHSEIYCGPETSLFSKQELYDNWKRNKHRLLLRGAKGLRDRGWHIFNGTNLLLEENEWNENGLERLIHHSKDFQSFAQAYFVKSMHAKNKSIWIEKTPANAYSFRDFKKVFTNAQCVHMFRNPYDTILSLTKRGFNLYYSTAYYLLNTSFGLRDKDACYHCSYESLTGDTQATLTDLCAYLGVPFEKSMLDTSSIKYADDPTRIGEWSFDETSEVSKNPSKFNVLEHQEKMVLVSGANSLCIDLAFAERYQLRHRTIKDLCKDLNYEFHESPEKTNFTKDKLKDQWTRFSRNYPFHFFRYPIKLYR